MAAKLVVRPTVLVPVRNAPAFTDIYFSDDALGGVRVPLESGLKVGDSCELEIAFAQEAMVFRTRGVARWRRPKAQRDLPAGVGVAFHPSEKHTRDLLLDFARGKEVSLVQRADRRFPVVIEVRYEDQTHPVVARTCNLSAGGAFILTEQLPNLGSELRLKLRAPGFLFGISVQAEVVWQRREHHRGAGVRFVKVSRSTRRKLNQLLRHVALEVTNSRPTQ